MLRPPCDVRIGERERDPRAWAGRGARACLRRGRRRREGRRRLRAAVDHPPREWRGRRRGVAEVVPEVAVALGEEPLAVLRGVLDRPAAAHLAVGARHAVPLLRARLRPVRAVELRHAAPADDEIRHGLLSARSGSSQVQASCCESWAPRRKPRHKPRNEQTSGRRRGRKGAHQNARRPDVTSSHRYDGRHAGGCRAQSVYRYVCMGAQHSWRIGHRHSGASWHGVARPPRGCDLGTRPELDSADHAATHASSSAVHFRSNVSVPLFACETETICAEMRASLGRETGRYAILCHSML